LESSQNRAIDIMPELAWFFRGPPQIRTIERISRILEPSATLKFTHTKTQCQRGEQRKNVASKREIRIVYHLVDIRNWKSIQAKGLLSTQRLVELSTNVDRSMLRRHRPDGEYLDFGAFIRDQSPMPRKSIERALRSGVTPEDWFELLNSKVFFWLDLNRLNRHRAACKSQKQVVLAIDAGRMLEQYSPFASVSPIISGNAMRAAVHRNLTTFVPYENGLKADGIVSRCLAFLAGQEVYGLQN
jgi:hypothetical protein